MCHVRKFFLTIFRFPFCLRLPGTMEFRDTSSSVQSVIINFVNTALGGSLGLMGNILSASKLGIIWFISGSALSMILTFCSIQFLCRSAELSQSTSTHSVASYYLGSRGALVTKLFVFLGNWSFICNIIQIFADFCPPILGSWLDVDDSNVFTSRWFAVSIGLVLIFPWILVEDISKLERLSTLCLVFALFIFVVLVLNATECILNEDINDSVEMLESDPRNIFYGLPTISWCWSLQFNVIAIYLTLSPRDRMHRIQSVSAWTVGILFIFYCSLGIAAYLVWGSGIDSDFIDNLSPSDSNYMFYLGHWVSTWTQFVICISCFCSIPIFAFESRTNLHSVLLSARKMYKMCCGQRDGMRLQRVHEEESANEDDVEHLESAADSEGVRLIDAAPLEIGKETKASRWIEGSIILMTAALVALLVRDLSLCLTVCGATYGCFISYWLPSTVYLKALTKVQIQPNTPPLQRDDLILKYIAVFSVVYGLVVCVAGLVTAFM